ncbi:MAG TPA: enolase C-terminal domain-like protein [Acidimicrobiales bacterium]|nr:enolase C-terminal domain-like protein [Acidimicrobiales bacterium]
MIDAGDELEAVELVRVRVPMRRVLRAAHGVTPPARDVVLVRVVGRDGTEGWGECSALEAPTYTAEHTAGAWAVLRDHLAPAALAGDLDRVRGHPMARAAVEIAMVDLALHRSGRTLATALGQPEPRHHGLAWCAVVGIAPRVEDLLAEVDDARSHLGSEYKLKIRPGWDVEPVGAVIRAFPDARVSVDANGSYAGADPDPLVEVGRLVAERGGYVEQPLAADDLLGHAALAARLEAPIALDESVLAPGDALAAQALGAARLVNVKPARLGGVGPTVALAEAVEGRLDTFLGGMVETGVGRSAALTIGRTCTSQGVTDLGPSSYYFDEDITEPLVLAFDALHRGSDRPGLTSPPRPDRLAELAVDRTVIRR